ncbi:hypothetical protein Tco_0493203, partial [Tanacetum coccineum]
SFREDKRHNRREYPCFNSGLLVYYSNYMGKEMGKLIQKLLLKQEVYGLLSSCLLQYFAYKENEFSQDMQLILKLRDDQKCMKKVEHSKPHRVTLPFTYTHPWLLEALSLSLSDTHLCPAGNPKPIHWLKRRGEVIKGSDGFELDQGLGLMEERSVSRSRRLFSQL